MAVEEGSTRRLQVLAEQMTAGLQVQPCKGAVKSLPRFDPHILETYMDELRDLKKKVYDLFKAHPELLPSVEEGLSKGEVQLISLGIELVITLEYSLQIGNI